MLTTMLTVPVWLLLLIAGGFGVIIGSYLNVVIYRFNTGKSLAGSSHCLSCQTDLRWFELFPLLSYLGLRGRCRTCSARIPSRYFWVELLTGVLFMSVVYTLPIWFWLPATLFVALLVVIAVYDIYHMVIPNRLLVYLVLVSIIHSGIEYWFLPDWYQVGESFLAAVLSYGFFATLWKVSSGRWIGYGDAKLAFPLGLLLGISGSFTMIVLSFWVGTIISLALIILPRFWQKRGQPHLRFLSEPLTMKSEVPFAPFLILGFLAVYLGQADVLWFIAYVLPV
jgi:prepilin signal peptidase PulO-like enzyme (type II secretory pathway)